MSEKKNKRLSFFPKLSFNKSSSKPARSNLHKETELWEADYVTNKTAPSANSSRSNTYKTHTSDSSITDVDSSNYQQYTFATGSTHFGINYSFQANKSAEMSRTDSKETAISKDAKAEYGIDELHKNVQPYGIRASTHSGNGMANADLFSVDYYYFPTENRLNKSKNISASHYQSSKGLDQTHKHRHSHKYNLSPQKKSSVNNYIFNKSCNNPNTASKVSSNNPFLKLNSQSHERKDYLHTPLVDKSLILS